MTSLVRVHGGWAGGWSWRKIVPFLRNVGRLRCQTSWQRRIAAGGRSGDATTYSRSTCGISLPGPP